MNKSNVFSESFFLKSTHSDIHKFFCKCLYRHTDSWCAVTRNNRSLNTFKLIVKMSSFTTKICSNLKGSLENTPKTYSIFLSISLKNIYLNFQYYYSSILYFDIVFFCFLHFALPAHRLNDLWRTYIQYYFHAVL